MSVRHSLQGIHFEWDAAKEKANRRKHAVEFEHPCEVFFDPFLKVFYSGVEGGEVREAIVGLTVNWQLLCVVFVERGNVFRIISARLATRAERNLYENP